jgi:phosphoribosyl 1,2-cyclic phosphate phosphodiesterase
LVSAQALELIDELQPRQAYLTHISHFMGKHADTELELPDNVNLAYDFMELAVATPAYLQAAAGEQEG